MRVSYIYPREICSLPKAGLRKTKRSRKKGKTKTLTCTTVQNEIAEENEKKIKIKKALCKKTTQAVECSGSSEDKFIHYDDDDDSDEDGLFDDEIITGDYVVVKVAGKACVVHYIAQVDAILDDEYEGIFLQKVLGRDERQVCVPNEDGTASFAVEDIVQKLPKPMPVGGSARLSNQLNFICSLDKWNMK